VPYLTAHTLDRLNEWLVRRRLAGRMSTATGPSVVEHLRPLGDGVHPQPDSLGDFEPTCRHGTAWECATPWPGAAENNAQWHAEMSAPAGGRVAAAGAGTASLILLHGWLMDGPQLAVYRSWARHVAQRGIEVWMPRLPYHLERAEPGEVSGQRCLSPDLSTSLDAVRQAVAETRLLARWLRRRGATSVGLWGMSLGGWAAALAATLDADWDALALWAPVASPAEVLFESGLVELLRDAIVDGGLSQEDFAVAEMAAMTPALSDNRVPRPKVLIVAGAYDQVISPPSIARMARRWNTDVRWLPHGHISLMLSRAPIRSTAEFLQQTML